MTYDQPISLASLLDEMTDLAALSRDSQAEYRIAHFSSYDRASLSPDEPDGWFANKDYGPFIRTECNQGREEHVIAEFDGPGCLNRVWMPDRRIPPKAANRAEETAAVRIYLDGSDTPIIEGLFQDVFNGTGLFPRPFAHQSLSSAISYFPVPFASSLKMTLEGEPFFYNVSARVYEPGTQVESFTIESMQALAGKIEETGERLKRPPLGACELIARDMLIEPGQEQSLTLPHGQRAISLIRMTVDATEGDYQDAALARVLEVRYDDGDWIPVRQLNGDETAQHKRIQVPPTTWDSFDDTAEPRILMVDLFLRKQDVTEAQNSLQQISPSQQD